MTPPRHGRRIAPLLLKVGPVLRQVAAPVLQAQVGQVVVERVAVGVVRVTPTEAAVLQSFPPGWPWHGSKTSQARQIGNAVPPLLAYHVLATVLDAP